MYWKCLKRWSIGTFKAYLFEVSVDRGSCAKKKEEAIYVRTNDMVADVMTKIISAQKFLPMQK